MLLKIVKGLGALVGLIILGVVGLVVDVTNKVGKTYDVPLPNIQRATSPEARARGEMIYHSICSECHAPAGETLAIAAFSTVHVTEASGTRSPAAFRTSA